MFDTLLVRFFGDPADPAAAPGERIAPKAAGTFACERAAAERRAVMIQRPPLTRRELSGLFWIDGAVSLGLAAGGRVLRRADTMALATLAAGCVLATVPGGVWLGGSAELGMTLAASYAATAAVPGCLPMDNRMLRGLRRLRSTLRAEPIKS